MPLIVNSTLMAEKWNNKALFRLIWPLIIEQILAVTMGVADTVMISPVGEFAVSGVNIIDNINNLLVIAFIALSTGGAVVCSHYIGRQEPKNASLAARQLVYFVTLISVVIMILALFFRQQVISLLYGYLEDDVMRASMVYLLITALSYPALALYNSCAALFRSIGNSKVPMRIALMVNIINIGGNALFIYVMRMGVAGVALSTLLSRIAAAVVLVVLLVKDQSSPVSLAGIQKITLIPAMLKRILRIGVPTGLENTMFQIGRLLTQRIFPMFGTSVIAANAVTSVITSISFMPGMAYGMALLTVVGQCSGAEDYEAAKTNTVKLLKVAWITVLCIAIPTFFLRGWVAGLFNLSPEAQSYAKLFLSIHCIFMSIGWTFSFALPNALRAAGDAKFTMLIGSISMWTVRVSGAYFFTFTLGLGPAGVWLAMGMDFLSRGTCFFLRWRSNRWQAKKLITD